MDCNSQELADEILNKLNSMLSCINKEYILLDVQKNNHSLQLTLKSNTNEINKLNVIINDNCETINADELLLFYKQIQDKGYLVMKVNLFPEPLVIIEGEKSNNKFKFEFSDCKYAYIVLEDLLKIDED
ncbi:hypothetical protein BFU36_00460 [Sulfolobus sp. A20]|uniref:hypothetical protein n=1 Tax=Sulfolobaceae TaxID=118883 RepID=UPI0008460FE4|nr:MULTISPECIES: hypothetical protein [unclassified Sulfolobus]TRM76596.1 hypothetical protein DJ523_00750 [Sulfolobus sp. E5]TRM76989.1 hypothetical protein DJ532_06345 [Sulfolobus sp. A20-N-F8]TRM78364.1 hypothetical protein DJ528_04940 [Sulfolobus sp. B5]TRM81972.1 hypothetical protein DJ524_02180 [Sulfolobus sp. D5]TRM84927.1 hypothetical protein DJ522_02750 [Sulfolobus sp. F3]TRM88392.1 hypothetical protein DJ529_05460 [Sulfolobus sp. C3]TRM99701.1 hypothetical protein DJ527_08290 [Sulf